MCSKLSALLLDHGGVIDGAVFKAYWQRKYGSPFPGADRKLMENEFLKTAEKANVCTLQMHVHPNGPSLTICLVGNLSSLPAKTDSSVAEDREAGEHARGLNGLVPGELCGQREEAAGNVESNSVIRLQFDEHRRIPPETAAPLTLPATVALAKAPANGVLAADMVAPRLPASAHLIIDALNFLTDYFCRIPSPTTISAKVTWSLLPQLSRSVQKLAESAKQSGFVLHFVVDAGWKTQEAADKWRKRREKEVRDGSRRLPLNTDTLLCDALIAADQRVYRAIGLDADDVVAKLAVQLGGFVVSGDRDMYRYDGLPVHRIFRRFSVKGGKLVLERASAAKQATQVGVGRRKLDDVPYRPDDWLQYSSKLCSTRGCGPCPELYSYVRGCCSPVARKFGNLHGLSQPLRRAAYWAMRELGAAFTTVGGGSEVFADSAVFESWPEWDEHLGAVVWINQRVEADGTLYELLRSPCDALEWLCDVDPSVASGSDHPLREFARYAIVAELAAAVSGEPVLAVLLKLKPARGACSIKAGTRTAVIQHSWSSEQPDPKPRDRRRAATVAGSTNLGCATDAWDENSSDSEDEECDVPGILEMDSDAYTYVGKNRGGNRRKKFTQFSTREFQELFHGGPERPEFRGRKHKMHE
jgi:hypothetical protein